MSKALYHLQTAFTSQVDTNNIGTNAGHLRERFYHEGQKGAGRARPAPGTVPGGEFDWGGTPAKR